MTREKQIDEFANSQVDCEFFDKSLYEGIILGAKWADEHPPKDLVNINKVIDWLRNNFTTKYDDCEALVDFNHLLKEFCEEIK